ncbi:MULTISPECIES: ribosome hibernation-promoting factor, HPF/YfiA family [Shewanella]|uniref:Ribosome-associated translation inhibitor RaiA n=2 Tax=Shewanella TaxID=22 RepID=A0A975AL50_9GAMM|nr:MULTISPECIES: ribosome-associated translation inhibitor RaiA [Shewanella]QSX30840.1 ribosome-associated translation inhibitor RaiA [Shewanella cyperi]QSX38057.1 ribosome-associated translation inhibitor RaiA [Shewanella sedimentimangrovi]QSX41619.1 ribosome-associated translation inhibitor RaiA [Shewanella cyperi]
MIKITSKQLEVTAPILARIESRFEKLTRHDVSLINPHVIISQEKTFFKIEASVGIPSGELFAQAKHENLYAAITAMGQKLEKQLNRLTHKAEGQRFEGVEEAEEEFEYELNVA